MDIGSWIKQKREQEYPLKDTRSFGFEVGLHQSSISRIENNKITPTLSSLVPIIYAVHSSPMEFFRDITGASPHIQTSQEPSRSNYLTWPDLKHLVKYLSNNPEEIDRILTHSLNDLVRSTRPKDYEERILSFGEVQKLTLTTPFYEFVIRYPISIDAEIIRELVLPNNIAIPQDFFTYIHSRENNLRQHNDYPRLELIKRKVDYSNVFNGAIGNIKVTALFDLDEAFEANGQIFVLGFKAMDYELSRGKYRYSSDEKVSFESKDSWRYVEYFIRLSRWYATLGIEPFWLPRLREEINRM